MPALDLSVVIATKDRGSNLVGTIKSVLKNPVGRWELIVVDQSRSTAAHEALADACVLDDPRLVYEHVSTTGACRARNHGIAMARGEVLMFTDDDCLVPDDWLPRTLKYFEVDRYLDIFFGGVTTPPSGDGWSYRFQPMWPGIVEPTYKHIYWRFGLASNMAVRRKAIDLIGPFDEMLGAGAFFTPGDDADYGYRAWRLGCRILTASEPEVVHLGITRGGRASALHQIGFAAMSTKHVRCGDVALIEPLAERTMDLIKDGVRSLLRGRRPSGWRSAAYIIVGIIKSLRHPVDVHTRLYRPDPRSSAIG